MSVMRGLARDVRLHLLGAIQRWKSRAWDAVKAKSMQAMRSHAVSSPHQRMCDGACVVWHRGAGQRVHGLPPHRVPRARARDQHGHRQPHAASGAGHRGAAGVRGSAAEAAVGNAREVGGSMGRDMPHKLVLHGCQCQWGWYALRLQRQLGTTTGHVRGRATASRRVLAQPGTMSLAPASAPAAALGPTAWQQGARVPERYCETGCSRWQLLHTTSTSVVSQRAHTCSWVVRCSMVRCTLHALLALVSRCSDSTAVVPCCWCVMCGSMMHRPVP